MLYLDLEATRFIKASQVPSFTDGQLHAAHTQVQELMVALKARRDALNKQVRRGQVADTKPVQKTKRWLKKAGSLNVLIEHELCRRKKAAAADIAESFVQASRESLPPEMFDKLMLAAIKATGL